MARPRKRFAYQRPKGSGIWYTDFYDRTKSPVRKYVRLRSASEEGADQEARRLRDQWAAQTFCPWTGLGAPYGHRPDARARGRDARANQIKQGGGWWGSEHEGILYVVVLKEHPKMCKVGITTTALRSRISAIQTANPFKIVVRRAIAVASDLSVIESKVHDLLADDWVRGEWFCAAAERVDTAIRMAVSEVGAEAEEIKRPLLWRPQLRD